MAAKKARANKKKGCKTSSVKIENKNYNKLAKRGKLKKKKKYNKDTVTNKQPIPSTQVTNLVEETEVVHPLENEDFEYFGNTNRDLKFLYDVNGKRGPRPKKRKHDDEDAEEYEQVPRKKFDQKDMRYLLPIKEKSRVVPRSMEVEEIAEEKNVFTEETMETEETETKKENLPVLTTVQIAANRRKKISERKQKIAVLASHIIENPEQNIRKLKELRLMLEEFDPDITVTIRKYVMLSLVEVFRDIIPDYRIRQLTDKEMSQSMKKDTKQLRDFEQSLLNNYQKFLLYLEATAKGEISREELRRMKYETKREDLNIVPNEAKKGLSEIAISCMCALMTSHPDFNFRNNIVAYVVPQITNKNSVIADNVIDTVKTIFKQDKEGEISLEITRLISKLIKSKNYNVKTAVIDVFLALRIKEVDFMKSKSEEIKKKMFRRERFLKTSRKERKRDKHMEKLNLELKEAAALEDKQKKVKLHTQIVEAIFLTYFRILKTGRRSALLSPVLEGLAKFAHLINIEFFTDLFAVINDLIESGDLTFRQTLHCIKTSFTILTGQGAALNVDPLTFYGHVYRGLWKLASEKNNDEVQILLDCLELMLIKRKKQVTQQRALAFIKRLSSLCIHAEPHAIIGILSLMRNLLHSFPRSDLLFDHESDSVGVYLPELEEPEHCNAASSSLWEIHRLRNHYHPVVRRFATHICKGAPLTGEGHIDPSLTRQSPSELFTLYGIEDEKNLFKPNVKKSNKKNKYKGYLNKEFEKLQKQVENGDEFDSKMEIFSSLNT